MKIISKIKTMLPKEVIFRLASVCDTPRIPSNAQKMVLAAKVLKAAGISFVPLGGATNRFVVQIGGYAMKIAIDQQGFKDNMMEYALSKELQPYATKSFESNGYILVQECVRLLTDDEWYNRKAEILRILDSLSHDYLLGDVGYLAKNRGNWGVRDDGQLVILDYAYCHRATQKLFECEVCGEGILTYDQNYDFLMCSNRTVCHARFTYDERKGIQGDQVDIDMISERKKESIIIGGEDTEKVVHSLSSGELTDENTVIIHNEWELEQFRKEASAVIIDYDVEDDLRTLIDIAEKHKVDPEGARLMHDEWLQKQEQNHPARSYVLADDFTPYRDGPIAAKPRDRMYGESDYDYQMRKKEERLMDEQRTVESTGELWTPTAPSVEDDPYYDPCDPANVIRELERAKAANPDKFHETLVGDSVSQDDRLDEFGLPIVGGIPQREEVTEEPKKGKVFIDGVATS